MKGGEAGARNQSSTIEAMMPPLPLPVAMGGAETAFGDAVDAYTDTHGISRRETFARIAAATGNSSNGLSLRYHQRWGDVWRFSG